MPLRRNSNTATLQHKILMVGVVVSILILYAAVLKRLVIDWIHLPDFSHGFLIPLVSGYIVYERRKALASLVPSENWLGLGVAIVGIMLLFLGNLATEYFTMRFSLFVVLGGIILFLLGKDFFKELQFPLIYLIFMIPIPSILLDRITFPMQLFASEVTTKVLILIGIPVLREGNVLQLSNTSLEVAEACSGIRSLISLLALAAAFAYFTQKASWKKVVLVLSTFPIAIFANAIRVSGTAVLAYNYGEASAQGFFHFFSGWILFVIAFICLFGVAILLGKIGKNSRG